MNALYALQKTAWNTLLDALLDEFEIYAPFIFEENIEYSIATSNTIGQIVYNRPKPSSPLKTFFLPVRENVIKGSDKEKKRIILGATACDLSGLSLLDEIYLDKDYVDPHYALRRRNTILIGFDCHSAQEHCHCTSYGFSPVPADNSDLVVSLAGEHVLIEVSSEKGREFQQRYLADAKAAEENIQKEVRELREDMIKELKSRNKDLPDYEKTGELVRGSDEKIWERYSDKCVSCGACSAICPTCSCFLFIERPEFEKVRSIDTCQYPGFERVAAGEDPLRALDLRFRNRYMCKYVWKPEKYSSKACTGCGRCIEACIGEINKNALFRELTKSETVSA